MVTTARRGLIGLLAGSAAAGVASVAPAQAGGWTPRALPVTEVEPGDLVVGPGGAPVRVALSGRSGSLWLITYDHRYSDGETVELGRFSRTRSLAVLARGVPLDAVRLTAAPLDGPSRAEVQLIDGGSP